MATEAKRRELDAAVKSARRKLFQARLRTAVPYTLLGLLPAAAVAVAVDQRWFGGVAGVGIVLAFAVLALLVPPLWAAAGLKTRFASALAIDEAAGLKDRVSSAYKFLENNELDLPRSVQIDNALAHAKALNYAAVFAPRRIRFKFFIPLFTAALVASFFVPPRAPEGASAAVDGRKMAQLNELRELQEELEATIDADEELREVLEKLQKLEERFAENELAERDVMIELGRLEEALKGRMERMGLDNLERELATIVPQLMAAPATREAALALREQELKRAAEEMEKLAQRVERGELGKEEREELARNMGVTASKLGEKKEKQDSFSGDFGKASESLKSDDREGFGDASRAIGSKFEGLDKLRRMKQMQQRLGLSKAGLGNAADKGPQGEQPGEPASKGGLEAGEAASGGDLGERDRLSESYKEMLRVTGMAGRGPVESQVEVTAGALSRSQLAPKDIYDEYHAVAEQAIEQENVPLSRRFHVKRYFQSIRPKE